MNKFFTEDTFDESKYTKTSWIIKLTKTSFDGGNLRLIVRVATGRKFWPLFTVLPNFEIGTEDPALKEIRSSLNSYTHPMIDRFIKELNIALTDLYKVEVDLYKIKSEPVNRVGYYSSNKF